MPKIKRLRVFAGPNGSGKSTLFETFKENFNPGVFINSDIIEKEIEESGFINLEQYNLSLTQNDWNKYCKTKVAKSLLQKYTDVEQSTDILIKENILIDKSKNTHSYKASLIASFLRDRLLYTNQNFSFETVMSHFSKLNEIQIAKKKGYKIYLYFICLDDPDLNISRVKNRIEKGGHFVDSTKIISRYTRTLENLLPSIKIAHKSYLFDNSDTMKLIAETNNGNMTIMVNRKYLPNWFINFVVNKL